MYTVKIQTKENLFEKSFDTRERARVWLGGMVIINPTARFEMSDPHGIVISS